MVKFFGLILFVFLISKVGWAETLQSIQKISFVHLFIVVGVFWIAFYIKSIRWRVVSKSFGISLSGYTAFKVFFIGLFLANITPGKLGDFGRLFYIRDRLPDIKVGWSSLIMDRIFDLICLAVFSLLGLVYYQVNFSILKLPDNFWFIVLGIIIMIGVATLLFKFRQKIKKIIRPWWIVFNSNNLNYKYTFIAISLTCLSMILIYGMFNYVAFVMEVHINHLGLFLGAFILGILTLLPITILGIGVRETSLVFIFQLYGLSSEDAMAISLILFLLQLVSLIPGAIWFYLSPVKLRELKELK